MREPLSVLVTTKNEERVIRACLESVRWAEEILVVDSGSTDGTLPIARSIADSSLFGNVVSLSKSSLMTEGDLGEFNRRSSSSNRWVIPKLKAQGSWDY